MSVNSVNMVILAAGKGTRMKSKMIKVMHQLGGIPMVEHVVRLGNQLGIERPTVVVGYDRDRVIQYLSDRVEYVVQEQQLGTGHAVMQAVPLLQGRGDTTIVISGDTPLIRPATLEQLLTTHLKKKAAVTLLTSVTEDPTGYGRIIRQADGSVAKIVEHKDASDEERLVREINLSIYCFDTVSLLSSLNRITNDNVQGEYYLTDCLEVLAREGKTIAAHIVNDATEAIMPNDRVQLAQAEHIIRQRIRERWMLSGVTMIDPQSVFIDDQVVIGEDTIIHPFTILRGKTTIGADCEIGPFIELVDAQVDDGVRIDRHHPRKPRE